MKNSNERPIDLPEADYKEWMVRKAFKRIMDDYHGSYQAAPLTEDTFIKALRDIKSKNYGRTN